MSRPRSAIAVLFLLLLLALGGCQRGGRLDVELQVHHADGARQLLATPVAVELIDSRGRLFRLPLAVPAALDLVAVAASPSPQRLALRGALPAGRYLGLRLVFDPRVSLLTTGGAQRWLAVDPVSEFAWLDLQLEAGTMARLGLLLDLEASLVRLDALPDVLRFLPRVSLLAAAGNRPSAAAGHDLAALPRFMLR